MHDPVTSDESLTLCVCLGKAESGISVQCCLNLDESELSDFDLCFLPCVLCAMAASVCHYVSPVYASVISGRLRLDRAPVCAVRCRAVVKSSVKTQIRAHYLTAVVVWLVRTIFNYRNTLFRYELLLNRFLTEKLSIRDGGEVRAYAAREARSEQARVAAALLAKLREHGQPMSEESLVRALVGEAARVEFGPALRELKRLGLVRESIVAKRPRGAGAEDDAERRTEDGRPSRAVGEEQGSAPEAALLEMDDEHQDVLVEAAPDGDEALSRHWQGLLGV